MHGVAQLAFLCVCSSVFVHLCMGMTALLNKITTQPVVCALKEISRFPFLLPGTSEVDSEHYTVDNSHERIKPLFGLFKQTLSVPEEH